MKKVFLLLIFFIAVNTAFSQNAIVPDARLSVRYSPETIENMLQDFPSNVELLNFELENGFKIYEYPDEKIQNINQLHYLNYETKIQGELVESVNPDNFNLFLYQYNRDQNYNSYYRIGNTNLVLEIISGEKLVERFNESRNYEK